MPAKGSKLKYANRYNLSNKDLYNEYIKINTNSMISYKTFNETILSSNEKIGEIIAKEIEGFKLPESLGVIVGSKTKKRTRVKHIDWENTRKYGKTIYFLNLHSFGNVYRIKYFNQMEGRKFKHRAIYSFEACREVSRSFSKTCKQGVQFSSWHVTDFLDKNLIDKRIANIDKRKAWE